MIDEASSVSDDLYRALRPMRAVSSGSLWLMSTPNGKSGFFYREWSGDKDWVRIKATAEEYPRIPTAFSTRSARLSAKVGTARSTAANS
jgi:hypothetical protein